MRGADTFTEGLFTLKKLDDFVPANHPLRVIRTMVNKALAEMSELFAQMYEDDIKGGRPSIAPEKLLRAMLPRRVRIVVVPIELTNERAAMKDFSGSIRTSIQRQSGGQVVAA